MSKERVVDGLYREFSVNESRPVVKPVMNEDIKKEEENPKKEKSKTDILNVLLLSFGIMTLFTAFCTAQGYTTTLHADVGALSLGILYFTFSFSNFFAPIVVFFIGNKFSIILGAIPYIIFIFSSGLKWSWVIVVASFFVGLSAPLVWSGQGAILVRSSGDKMSSFSGVFWAIYQTNTFIGFLLSGLFLQILKISEFNMFMIYGWIGILGIFIIFFLRDKSKEALAEDKRKSRKEEVREFVVNIFATIYVLLDIKFILLNAAFFYNGYSYAFYFGTVTHKFGTSMIAWTFTCFAVVEFLGSLMFGKLIECVGIRQVFYTTFILHAISIIYTFFLDYHTFFYFITICLCGLADSGLNTTIWSVIGKYYSKNAAAGFAAFKFVQSLASSFQFLTENVFSFFQIQMILFGLIVLSLIGFFILDCFLASIDKFDPETSNGDRFNILYHIGRLCRFLCCSNCQKDEEEEGFGEGEVDSEEKIEIVCAQKGESINDNGTFNTVDVLNVMDGNLNISTSEEADDDGDGEEKRKIEYKVE